MTIEQAKELLDEEYERVRRLEYVHNPLAYALYQVWKKADKERSKMENRELKPCECGGKCEVLSIRVPSDNDCLYYHNLYYVECANCGKTAYDYYQSKYTAIKEWNRRANDGRS